MAHRRSHDAPLEPELPVTPMLDMAFQLLAFFVMTYHPSGLEGQMALSLPATGEAKAATPEEVDPKASSDMELELPSEVTVVVQANLSAGSTFGLISHMQVQQREGNTPIDTLQALETHLKKVRSGLQNQNDIKIQASGKLKWDEVVKVMDICRKADFKGIGFAPPPDGGS